MKKPYKEPITQAFPDVKVPPPRVSKVFVRIVLILSKIYLFMLFGFAKIIVHGEKLFFDIFKKTLNNESRCLIAFRHPDGREPQLLSWFFIYKLRKLAAKKKVKFPRRPHAIFVYGYEVVRWGGFAARLFMPNLGAIPIHHTKLDSKAMARLYEAIYSGPYPLALAPEGQVSYSTDTIPRLESGTIRIGFQAAKGLEDKKIPLEILPVSVHFRYGKKSISSMKKLLTKIEKLCAIPYNETAKLSLEERIKKCREYILEVNENRYGIKTDDNQTFEERLETVVNTALVTSERMLGIDNGSAAGSPVQAAIEESDFFSRLYRVRHECWDKIFIPNEDNLDKIDYLKRNVLNLKAGAAWHIARHQELADFGWYFYRQPLPNEETVLHNKIEYVQNLWDFANRTMGGAFSDKINIPPSKVIIKTAPCINLTERLPQFKEDRKSAIETATADLEKAYLNCIDEVNKLES